MTTKFGLSGTEKHPDHDQDQCQDHVTKKIRGHVHCASDLLRAVADGDPAATALADALVATVLDDPITRRAIELDDLLRARSPFALVRAVELAELLLERRAAKSGATRTGGGDR